MGWIPPHSVSSCWGGTWGKWTDSSRSTLHMDGYLAGSAVPRQSSPDIPVVSGDRGELGVKHHCSGKAIGASSCSRKGSILTPH